jgi:cephalosporin hydroxylase
MRLAASAQRVMVILDSDHSEAHVFDELALLSPLVTPGAF